MNTALREKVLQWKERYDDLSRRERFLYTSIGETQELMNKALREQKLLEDANLALQLAKPLLSSFSIKQCEELANSALQTIFELPYTVEWDALNNTFLLNKGDFKTDLTHSEGGGIATVISFCFSLFLLIKLGKRRVMFFDEAFYAVSDSYLPAFIAFVRKTCAELGVDILLVSHDPRITIDDVDRCYLLEDGKSKQLK